MKKETDLNNEKCKCHTCCNYSEEIECEYINCYDGIENVISLDDYNFEIDVLVYKEKGKIPEYKTIGSSGCDFYSTIYATLRPGESILIPTGLHMVIPEGYELQIRPRSGLALKHGITVLNTPGTVDSDYRDEIGIILINHGKDDFIINEGDRIAQGVFVPVVRAVFHEVETKEEFLEKGKVNRNGGFGHTGI